MARAHIPSESMLREQFSQVLEKNRHGTVEGNLKLLREQLVKWRDGVLRSRDLLNDANKILEAHGIEHLQSRNGRAEAYYVNMGDTYTPTILLDLGRDRVWATSWGSWVEAEERRGNKFD